MKLPFHGVQVCGDILFAARGGNIYSFNSDGAHISSWKFPAEVKAAKNGQNPTSPPQDDQGPPAKRIKLENDKPEVRKKGQPKKPGPMSQPSERPMVIIMSATKGSNTSHLIAVTSDKSIWVFEHDGRGGLKQLSRRTMPKRPCSIVLTPDNKDILAADKFGDVYSLPLIPSEQPVAQVHPAQETPSPSPAPEPTGLSDGHFTPQATELTVHTKRNRRALLDQKVSLSNPKALLGGTPKRVDEVFERQLLLGHVSLLTAIALGHDEQGRRYIITADRDEHIRVSRGTREQAHVIESYCMGHEEFVHRLLIPKGCGNLLVSAGGDENVYVWRWREGVLLGRADLIGRAREVVEGIEKIAVTGLCCWPVNDGKEMRILMICERVPAIFLFTLSTTGSLEPSGTIRLPGNPFSIGVVEAQQLIVAVDPSHKDAGAYDLKKSLLRINHLMDEYRVSEDVIQDTAELEAEALSDDDISDMEMDKLLYNAEMLRKSNFEDREAAEETKIEQEG
ncbi:tRNA (guanine-N(7)-)-methyltransferase non-catalytic subunit trm82 [Gnomoniopsis smithogilvyi]|uniref:tRNA (Guanine-N(7)-)-methyltransferase non-catalytic subunit trm82 n=1 Tax=Gnomoniopsis smithogilvyi TaxID=1191159 RepID=A0A9W8Z539_9PEZI|nr:tRNA (guanine-N(7)-)-methyltransferase non-catalytic subunit trm82 [Gnomoniopsis smithogilvyi]